MSESKTKGKTEERQRTLRAGQRVRLSDNRVGVIESVEYANQQQVLLSKVPSPEQDFLDVKSYTVKTRDSNAELVVVSPDEVVTVPEAQFDRQEAH